MKVASKSVLRAITGLCVAGAATAAIGLSATPANATIVLTFEGLGELESIDNFYNGGLGGSGSGPGTNFGISFSSNSLAIVQTDPSSNFQGEPSADTVATFLSGGADIMNDSAGFKTGFSFFYSAINHPGSIEVWSGLNGTGTLLTSLALPKTPAGPYGSGACPSTTGQFCPFEAIGVTFSGTAESVDFGGSDNGIVFDNITIGSATAGSGSGTGPTGVPEPASLAMLGTGLMGLLGLMRRRKRA